MKLLFKLSPLSLALCTALSFPATAELDPIIYSGEEVTIGGYSVDGTLIGTDTTPPSMLITEGADVTVFGDSFLFGNGSITISGADTKAHFDSLYLLGGDGEEKTEQIIINNGAQVDYRIGIGVGSINENDMFPGVTSGNGKLIVSGEGSSLINSSPDGVILLGMPNSGTGNVIINEGGTIGANAIYVFDGTLAIGNLAGEEASGIGTLNTEMLQLGENGSLIFNHTANAADGNNYIFDSPISGAGNIETWAGDTTLMNDGRDGGNTIIHGGVLHAGKENSLSAGSKYQIEQSGTLNLSGFNQTLGEMNNGGAILLNGNADAMPGTILTIDGDYTGAPGASIAFNTELAGDDSATDKLLVLGDTHGSTEVKIENHLGGGAQTVEGIRLIEVVGASDANSFTYSGRITAGLYDYTLVQNDTNGDWYLTSKTEPEPTPDTKPIPNPDPDNKPDVPQPAPEYSTIRPEAGAYLGNLAAANTLFVSSLHDRSSLQPLTTWNGEPSSLWLRLSGGRKAFSTGSQIESHTNSYVLQGGGDVASWSSNGADSLHLGVMLAYGDAETDSHSSRSDYDASGSTSGYSTGLYATWYSNDTERTGAYVDSWLQYAWFDNTVSGEGLNEESYDSNGLQASVEAGYAWRLNDAAAKQQWFIEPHAQVVWSNIEMDEHTEANGTKVKQDGDDQYMTRLGLRTYFRQKAAAAPERYFQPYAEVNWLHNSSTDIRFDKQTADIQGITDTGELAVGIEGNLTQSLNIRANVSGQLGQNNYHSAGGSLELRYHF